jgi:uncharacterized protein (DUF1697 family)
MALLRAVVEDLGSGEVRTLLNSGNVVFTARGIKPQEAAARMEDALSARIGVSARIIVLTAAEICCIGQPESSPEYRRRSVAPVRCATRLARAKRLPPNTRAQFVLCAVRPVLEML